MALVFLAGGGSVGHLAPGFAVRDALRASGHDAVFVTPGEAREATWFPADDPPRLHVPAPRLPQGLASKALFPLRMGRAVLAARRHLKAARPAAVLALGGWPCAPTALAASFRGVPLHLLATDAVPGLVVRRLARRATVVWLTDPRAAAGLPEGTRSRVVGSVVRRAVTASVRDPARFGLAEGKATLFVVGGSLGAQGLNARVRAGLVAAVRARPGLASRVQVIHATGTDAEADAARADYAAAGLACHVTPFVAAVGAAYRTADLVVCRGGAGTVAELAALGRPAVIVPYPHHADRQQFKNAEGLVARGQATLVEEGALDEATFAREVLDVVLDPGALARRAPAADTSSAANADGAATIAAELVRSNGTSGGGSVA